MKDQLRSSRSRCYHWKALPQEPRLDRKAWVAGVLLSQADADALERRRPLFANVHWAGGRHDA